LHSHGLENASARHWHGAPAHVASTRLYAATDNGLGPAMDACKKCVRALCGKSPVLDAKDSMLELQVRAAGRCMPRQGRCPGCMKSSTLMHDMSDADTQHIQ